MLVMLFSTTFITPIFIAWIYSEATSKSFFIPFLITFASGALIWLLGEIKKSQTGHDLYPRDGFTITVFFWLVLSGFGALPFLFVEGIELSITDAIFESVSGLTTTGATILSGLDELPKSLLFYRQQLQWLGGIGIVVIAVAVLPMLGMGGMQLYRTEMPGLAKNAKLTPRIAKTAKALFSIYATLTGVCALAYWIAGMSLFDAVCHSFSTIAIGGFSTHDDNMGYYNGNYQILVICMVFMVISGINYALHFHTYMRRSLGHYFNHSESKLYFFLLFAGISVIVITLIYTNHLNHSQSLIHGSFQVVSMLTTTGFTTQHFATWTPFIPLLLMLMAMVGACAGSTCGGIKVIRLLVILKQSLQQLRLLIHPRAVFPLKIDEHTLAEKTISLVWGFIGLYILCFNVILILLIMAGLDFISAWSATASSLSNLGPALGELATNYSLASEPAKWILCFGMLLGRLELFTLLVVLVPMFWRK